MRIGAIGALLAVAAGVAHADQAAPEEQISAVDGKVARVEDLSVGRTHVILVEWTGLKQGDPPAVMPTWTTLVPFDASVCDRYFAIATDAKTFRKGSRSRGLLVTGPRYGRIGGTKLPWCQLHDATAGTTFLPSLPEVARSDGDFVIPGLEELFGFFGPAGTETPFDDEIDGALRELDSTAGLQLALDHARYYTASQHFWWRTHVENFDIVEQAVWRAADPDHSLVQLYWHLSPSRAAARVRDEFAKDPTRARPVLAVALGWPEVIALEQDLAAAGIGARSRIDEVRELEDAAAKIGVTDAASLALYAWSHGDDVDRFVGMRLSAAGPHEGACDLQLPFAGYELRVMGDCDAESAQRGYQLANGSPVTVTGIVRNVYRGDAYVEVDLDAAHYVDGYPPAPVVVTPVDAGAPVVTAIDAAPTKPAKQPAGGGCCGAGGEPGLALAALVLWRLRRRRLSAA